MPHYFDYRGPVRRRRGKYLPHLEVDPGIYFVTFCLHDSVPKKKLARLGEERERLVAELYNAGKLDSARLYQINGEYFEQVDDLLDAGAGSRMLANPHVAQIVAGAFEYFHRDRYDLDSWIIMSNHAHVGLQTRKGHWLSDIMHSWKSFTANKINKLLGRQGEPVWQADYFDRLVRTEEELERVRHYIWHNADAVGQDDWKWRRQYERRWKEEEKPRELGRPLCSEEESKAWWDEYAMPDSDWSKSNAA
ncbi:transposase [Persicimonas caeni]|uniref:Transposase n=1 Tax=Persicimonas caeni TaxID=2292766 RepID=A0A4Y6PXG3_PERCE|nr:transposase [Persicimonas caeni]QDG52953.1 transposase [Persicimonas caeni]QED34175.1 transposase [Persicimonas caeni]